MVLLLALIAPLSSSPAQAAICQATASINTYPPREVGPEADRVIIAHGSARCGGYPVVSVVRLFHSADPTTPVSIGSAADGGASYAYASALFPCEPNGFAFRVVANALNPTLDVNSDDDVITGYIACPPL